MNIDWRLQMKHFVSGIFFLLLVLLNSFVPVQAGTDAARVADEDIKAMSLGEIRKIDIEAGKLTIKHGPIANLDMSAMTMTFRVQEPVVLGSLKVGDKIRFVAERINGSLMVTQIERAE
jgi:Cu(I)/Ag(I) efflux system protein CusF